MSGKILVYAGVPMTLAVPGMLQAMAWVLLLSPRKGSKNQVLAVLIWNMWDEGYIPAVAAIGTLLMLSLLFLTLLICATVFRSHRIEMGMR